MSPRATLDIVSLSDLHLDYRANWQVAEAMAYRLIELAPDVLVLAGDLASIPSRVEKALTFFKDMAPDVVFVPGNHDLWAPTAEEKKLDEIDTWVMYRQVYAEMCDQLGIHYLPRAPLIKGEVALVGTCGWYDYSIASPLARLLHSRDEFAEKAKGTARWTDGWRVRWRDDAGEVMPDEAVTRIMEADLKAQLDGLPPAVSKVVAVTHHLAFKEACTGHGGLAGDYFTAFMGSTGLGEILAADPRVGLAIFGHLHKLTDVRVGRVRAVARPLGNPRDYKGEPKDVARERMGVFEV